MPGNLYAVVDAGVDADVMTTIVSAEKDPLAQTLFDGEWAAKFAHVGPYLVDVGSSHDQLLDSVLEAGWGKSWGIFVATNYDFVQTRSDLRKLLIAELPNGESIYFRFFDPRVLGRLFEDLEPDQVRMLPRCTAFEGRNGSECTVATARRPGVTGLLGATDSVVLAVHELDS